MTPTQRSRRFRSSPSRLGRSANASEELNQLDRIGWLEEIVGRSGRLCGLAVFAIRVSSHDDDDRRIGARPDMTNDVARIGIGQIEIEKQNPGLQVSGGSDGGGPGCDRVGIETIESEDCGERGGRIVSAFDNEDLFAAKHGHGEISRSHGDSFTSRLVL